MGKEGLWAVRHGTVLADVRCISFYLAARSQRSTPKRERNVGGGILHCPRWAR